MSEWKRAEEALRRSEERYRRLVETTDTGYVIVDNQGVVLEANQAYVRLSGHDRLDEILGRSVMEWTAAEEREKNAIAVATCMKDGFIRNLEITYVDRNGQPTPVEINATVVETEGRETILSLCRDISERKQAEERLKRALERLDLGEEALRRSETLFFSAFRISPAATILSRLQDGRCIDANEAYAQLVGFSREELAGRTTTELNIWLSPEERKRAIAGLSPSGRGRDVEITLRRKDGSLRLTVASAEVLTIEGEQCILSFFYDITDHKQAEAAIAAEKERLAVTLRSIGDGVITTDIRGAIVIMNRVAEELTGWSQNEAEGRPLEAVFSIVNETTREPCENPIERVLSTGRIVELANHALLTSRDGTERVIADSGAPIMDRDGKTIGVVLVFRDMTEKQKILDAMQRAAKLDSLGVLAGGIAHDFNNLLTGLFGYVELARSVSKDARVIEYLEASLATMNRARALTMQLLTFAKGGAPAQKATPSIPFIQEAVGFALSGANVACHFSLGEDVWPCNIDKNQIAQVIDNIVINAQQAMPNGGFIEVAVRNLSVEEGEYPSLSKGRYVKVSIKDGGIGMPKDVMPRIFDPFYTTKTKGHGLGLATCYSIVSRHGGWIDVESEPGRGSTFYVYLPAATESVAVNSAATVKQEGSGRVIVVDDEEVVRNTVGRMVEALGYTVVCARDGREAIDLYVRGTKAGQRFAGMILDLTIRGGMGGREAVTEIRKLDKELPVFVASGYGDDPVMRNPVEYGFTGSIGKPFTITELADMLSGKLKD